MKQSVLLMVAAVLLVSCGRQPQKPEAGSPSAKRAPVVAAPNASTNELPVARMMFLQQPPPGELDPASEAARVLSVAQELLRQGRANEAADVLSAAVKDPACESGRQVLVAKLVALLLASDRVEEAQTVCLEYAADAKAASSDIGMIHRYLVQKGDMKAAAEWADRLGALPLSEPAADQNLTYQLGALAASGSLDEAIRRVPGVVARADESRNIRVLGSVASGMIKGGDFENAKRFLAAVEAAAPGKSAYADMVSNMRHLLEQREGMRARTALPAQGK